MKNRISSIMNMKRKRRGSIIICAALLLTIVVGCVYEISAGEPNVLIAPFDDSLTVEEPESVSIIGEWIMIKTTLSTEMDGQEAPENNIQPVLQTIYVFTDNTYKHEFHGHGSVEGTIHQTGHHEYLILNRSVSDANGTTHRDDEQWLRYSPESGLLRFTLYSQEDSIYVHTYFERTGNLLNDQTHNKVYTDEQVRAAMAGNWRSQRYDGYTANDMIISLFNDGTWEWSGPLATDHVDGGSFIIERVEDGTYSLTFFIEHTNSPYTQIGLEINNVLQYDPRNDQMNSLDESTEIPGAVISVRYIRVPHFARDEAPTWDEDGLTSDVTNTADGIEYRFDDLGFAFTLPASWEGYYDLRGDEYGIQVYFDYMGVFATLFFISQYDQDFDTHMIATGEYEDEVKFFDVDNTTYIMYNRRVRSLLLATEDFSSFHWDLNDEQNQEIKNLLSQMFIETDTIVANSITILSDIS